MRKTIAVLGMIGALTLGGAGMAQATTTLPASGPSVAQEDATQDDNGDKGLWGLAGLLGLVGLAGLAKKKDHRHDTGRVSNVTNRPGDPGMGPRV
jgi:hypothetical protein